MPVTLDLTKSREELERLTQLQAEQIKEVYKGSLETVQSKLAGLKGVEGATASLQTARLKQLEKELTKELSSASAKVESIITGSMGAVATAVVADNAKLLKDIGMEVKGALAHVPPDVVASLSTGQVYAGDWTLSKALWTAEKKAQTDIEQVIAQGVAQNKSSFEIAKDLEKYVDPSKAKDWAWNKVYPGTAARVDYNAQRLARTMTAHAYQQSLVMTVKDNPFVTGIKWKSAHAAGRTCEICNDRDGTVFAKDELPLDHPNGLCSWIPAIPDSYEDISKRIGDWEPGSDPEMDKFAKSLGYEKPASKIANLEVPKTVKPGDVDLWRNNSTLLKQQQGEVTRLQEEASKLDIGSPKWEKKMSELSKAKSQVFNTDKEMKVMEGTAKWSPRELKLRAKAEEKATNIVKAAESAKTAVLNPVETKVIEVADDLKGVTIPKGVTVPEGLTDIQRVELQELKEKLIALDDQLNPFKTFVGKTDDWTSEKALFKFTRNQVKSDIASLAKIETDRADVIYNIKNDLTKYHTTTQAKMVREAKALRTDVGSRGINICNDYFQTSNSFEMNEFLYTGKYAKVDDLIAKGLKSTVSAQDRQIYNDINAFSDLLSKRTLKEDLKLVRYTEMDQFNNILDKLNLSDIMSKASSEKEAILELNSAIKGAKFTQQSFMSTSFETTGNVFTSRPVEIQVFATKGTSASVTPNFYGQGKHFEIAESEIAINKGTKMEILGVESKGGKILLKLRTLV